MDHPSYPRPAEAEPEQPARTGPEAMVSTSAATAPDPIGADGALSTGDVAVDAAVARLADLDSLDLDAHAAVYEQIHQDLHQALDANPSPDSNPSPANPSGSDRHWPASGSEATGRPSSAP
ncbi:MAG: hypothetical protein ACRDPG_06515 [Nocardioidaceae bacterium]